MENIGKAGTARNEKVVNCLYPKPDAIFRLICFPWAGGGSLYFAKWAEHMPDSVEVWGPIFMSALHLKEKHKLEPVHLFVSSTYAPHATAHTQEEKEWSDEQLRSLILKFGGTQMDILNDKDFSEHYIHIMKADVHVFTNYIFNAPSEPVLSCNLTCFLGSEDVVKDVKDVTSGRLDILMCPGNHFYIKEPANETFIRNYITKCLELSMFT